MYANSFNQLISFSIFIIVGCVIGIIFDVFRILRKSFKTKDIVTYLEDILFWIIAGIILLYSIFKFNNGELRFYLFLGILTGISLYITLISSYFIKINVTVIKFIKKIIHQLLKIILLPIQLILKILRKILIKPISFIFINIRAFSTKKISFLKNKLKKLKINKKAQKKEGI